MLFHVIFSRDAMRPRHTHSGARQLSQTVKYNKELAVINSNLVHPQASFGVPWRQMSQEHVVSR